MYVALEKGIRPNLHAQQLNGKFHGCYGATPCRNTPAVATNPLHDSSQFNCWWQSRWVHFCLPGDGFCSIRKVGRIGQMDVTLPLALALEFQNSDRRPSTRDVPQGRVHRLGLHLPPTRTGKAL